MAGEVAVIEKSAVEEGRGDKRQNIRRVQEIAAIHSNSLWLFFHCASRQSVIDVNLTFYKSRWFLPPTAPASAWVEVCGYLCSCWAKVLCVVCASRSHAVNNKNPWSGIKGSTLTHAPCTKTRAHGLTDTHSLAQSHVVRSSGWKYCPSLPIVSHCCVFLRIMSQVAHVKLHTPQLFLSSVAWLGQRTV